MSQLFSTELLAASDRIDAMALPLGSVTVPCNEIDEVWGNAGPVTARKA